MIVGVKFCVHEESQFSGYVNCLNGLGDVRDVTACVTTGRCLLLVGLRINSQSLEHNHLLWGIKEFNMGGIMKAIYRQVIG